MMRAIEHSEASGIDRVLWPYPRATHSALYNRMGYDAMRRLDGRMGWEHVRHRGLLSRGLRPARTHSAAVSWSADAGALTAKST